MIKEGIIFLMKGQLSINLKNAPESRGKSMGQSVLDSGKSICKVPEVGSKELGVEGKRSLKRTVWLKQVSKSGAEGERAS